MNSPVAYVDQTRGIIAYKGKELIVKYKHFTHPHLYAIKVNSDNLEFKSFKVFRFSEYPIPEFEKVTKYKKKNYPRLYCHTEETFRRESRIFNIKHDAFNKLCYEQIRMLNEEVDEGYKYLHNPAKAISTATLYDWKEWSANPPIIKVNDDGERIVIQEGITPDPLCVGMSFCSIKEANFKKSIGRDISLGRALKEFDRKYL